MPRLDECCRIIRQWEQDSKALFTYSQLVIGGHGFRVASSNHQIGVPPLDGIKTKQSHLSTHFDSVDQGYCLRSGILLSRFRFNRTGAQGNPEDLPNIMAFKMPCYLEPRFYFTHRDMVWKWTRTCDPQRTTHGLWGIWWYHLAMDKAEWESVEDMLEQGGASGSIQTLLVIFRTRLRFWLESMHRFCRASLLSWYPDFRSELTGAQIVRFVRQHGHEQYHFSRGRISIGTLTPRDVYRRDISYPMSKTDSDIMPFMRAYYADYSVLYHRDMVPHRKTSEHFFLLWN